MSESTATEVMVLMERERVAKRQRLMDSFEIWWHNEGSAMRPKHGEDSEEHVHRVCRIAWMNGAYVAA